MKIAPIHYLLGLLVFFLFYSKKSEAGKFHSDCDCPDGKVIVTDGGPSAPIDFYYV